MSSSHTRRRDYYLILQVDSSADTATINAAFRKLARKYHPDANPSSDATRAFQEINEAHAVLSNQERRATYDRERPVVGAGDIYTRAARPAGDELKRQHPSRESRNKSHHRRGVKDQATAEAARRVRRTLVWFALLASVILFALGYFAYYKIYPRIVAARPAPQSAVRHPARSAPGHDCSDPAARNTAAGDGPQGKNAVPFGTTPSPDCFPNSRNDTLSGDSYVAIDPPATPPADIESPPRLEPAGPGVK
jgi:hypothetical protein